MIISMTHLEITGLREILHDAVQALQGLGVTHIEESNPRERKGGKSLKTVALEEKKAAERRDLEAIENMIKEMVPLVRSSNISADKKEYLTDPQEFDSILTKLKFDRDKLIGLSKEKTEMSAQLEMAKKYREVLKILPAVLSGSQATQAVNYFAISIEKSALPDLKNAFRHEINGTVSIRTVRWKGTQLIGVVSFPAALAEDVKDVAWKQGATEIILPSEFRGKPVKESLVEIERRLSALPRKIGQIDLEISLYLKENAPRILRIHQETEDGLDRFRILGSVAESKYLFVLSVWVPTEKAQAAMSALKNRFRDLISINEIEIEEWHKEEIPVTLKNPGFLKPFELLLSFFPPPIYGTLDATFLLFLTFPVFFGLILGDIGYGTIMLAIMLWVRGKAGASEQLKAVSAVGLWCAGWSILFGFVFGEAFGNLLHGTLKPLWNDRMLITTEYLILSIIIGICHIYLGLFLGFYLGIKEGHGKHAWEKLGFILFLTGSLLALSSQMFAPGIFLKVGLVMIGASILLLGWAAGVAGLIEIFSVISNVLSYARIMAIGVASVALAEVANEFGGAGGFFAIVIAVLVHGINMLLGMFDPTIQGLRLHYVEFFTKFYQSGGREFQPLQKRGG
ncbi:MAG: hypothetical protein HY587_01295 [Candidatus Omnitrophica bacterium]|nr:hypothetical protein [Candidatus Omnitrophota bacterium]